MKTLFAVLLISAFSFSAFAATKTVTCNGCAATGYSSNAKLSHKTVGTGYVVVLDFYNQVASKYHVSLRYEKGEPIRNAIKIGLSSSESHDANVLFAAREEIIINMERGASFYTDSKITSDYGYIGQQSSSSTTSNTSNHGLYIGTFDVRGNPYTYLTDTTAFSRTYTFYVSSIGGMAWATLDSVLNAIAIPGINDMGIELTINFYNDASLTEFNGSLRVQIDAENSTFFPESGRDADGNVIPMTKQQVNGRKFSFNTSTGSNNFPLFNDYIQSNFGDFGGGSSGCSVTQVNTGVAGVVSYTYRC